jgi:hypothetical protein
LHPFYIGGQLIVLIWNRQLIFGSHQLARIWLINVLERAIQSAIWFTRCF